LKGLGQAMTQTAGIGGYPKIIYIDGHRKNPADWVLEISDCRSKLALEMVTASIEGLLLKEQVESLLEELIFCDGDFHAINDKFYSAVGKSIKLDRYLRNYPVR